MAGIRGAKNPMPVKPATASGIFKQRGSPMAMPDAGVKSHAMQSSRKGPTSGRNSGTSPNSSHMVNAGLKNGTSNR